MADNRSEGMAILLEGRRNPADAEELVRYARELTDSGQVEVPGKGFEAARVREEVLHELIPPAEEVRGGGLRSLLEGGDNVLLQDTLRLGLEFSDPLLVR